MMPHPPESLIFIALKKYTELAYQIRGKVIDYCTALEGSIENFIAGHFVGGDLVKKQEFINMFFWDTQMGLGRKREILMTVIKTYYPLIIKEYPSISDDLKKVNECRNKLAHSPLNYERQYRYGVLTVEKIAINHKASIQPVIFDMSTIEPVIESCRKYERILFAPW
jgi:hypothetical protein